MTRPAHILIAHGAGAPMDSPFLDDMARLLDVRGLTVHRFEFPYMAERRTSGRRRPAPRAETLCDCFRAAVQSCRTIIPPRAKLLIGGKSMGGRVAAMVAGETDPARALECSGLVMLGYPFHPPRKPEQLRLAPLARLNLPALIVQGTRDPLGTFDEVQTYGIPAQVTFTWVPDGDHDLAPRARSGMTPAEARAMAADAISSFAERLPP